MLLKMLMNFALCPQLRDNACVGNKKNTKSSPNHIKRMILKLNYAAILNLFYKLNVFNIFN